MSTPSVRTFVSGGDMREFSSPWPTVADAGTMDVGESNVGLTDR